MTTANFSTVRYQLPPANEPADTDQESLKAGALPVPREGARKTVEVRWRLSLLTLQSGAPRKSHTWETRHLAGPIRGVGYAGRCESVSAGLHMYGVGDT